MPKLVDHDEQRRAIADAAISVIDTLGLDGARLRDVAEAADVTTGAVTHYFDGKDAVLEAAMDALVQRILYKQAAAPRASGPAALIEQAAGFLPVDAESRREWRVWLSFWGRAVVNERLRVLQRRYYAEITARLATAIRLPDRRGRSVSARDARLLADGIVAAIDGIGTRAVLEADDWPPKRQRDTLATMLTPMIAALS